MAEAAGSSLLNIRNSFSGSTISGPSIRGEDVVNKREFVEQSKKFTETQQKDTQSLSTIQEQFNNLQTQINTLATGLTKIESLIQKDTVSEQTLLKKEQSEENKYSQKKIRAGNENQLEQKIQSALVAPVQQAAAKVENIFGRIGQALTGLFLGWLGVQGVKALKAAADKDYDALTNIKNNIVKNIGLAIGGIAAIKLGFGLITKAIMGVVAKVGSIIANVIKLPFKAAAAAATGLGSMLRGGPKPSGGGGVKPRGGGGVGPGLIGGLFSGINSWLNFKNGENVDAIMNAALLLPTPPIVRGLLGLGVLADDISEVFGGNLFGKNPNYERKAKEIAAEAEKQKETEKPASTSTTAAKVTPASTPQTPLMGEKKDDKSETDSKNMTPGPVSGSTNIQPTSDSGASSTGISAPSTAAGTGISAPATTSSSTTSGSSPTSTAQTTMMPQAGDLTLNVNADKSEKEQKYWKSEADYWNTIASGLKAGSSYEELGLNQDEIDYLEGNSDKPPFMMDRKIPEMETKPTELTNKTIQTKPITAPSIPPLEQPSPNVMVASAPAPQQQKTAIPSSTGTDVPFIPSANPNNFYVMYSKLNYNVVV